MFEKGQILKVEIEDISDMGQGIGKVDGFTVFVNNTLPGDVAEVSLIKVKKRYAIGNLKRLITPSPARTESPCPYAEDCGGCVYMGYDYDAELKIKARQVADKLERLGGVKDPLMRDIVGMAKPWAYRNKAVFQVGSDGSVGFNRVRTHDVVDCVDCKIQTPAAMAAAAALREYLKQHKNSPVRNMTVKTAFGTGEVMVVIGTDGRKIAEVEYLAELVDDAVYEAGYSLESFYIDGSESGKNNERGGRSSANKKDPELAAGSRVIKEHIGNLDFEISPRSFYQVNPVMMQALYDIVRDYTGAGLADSYRTDAQGDAGEGQEGSGAGRPGKVILDLYCGVGSIGLWCLASGCLTSGDAAGSEGQKPFVLGIESEKQAVIDANRNAVINGIVRARYICGKAEDVLPELIGGAKTDGADVKTDGESKKKYYEELYDAAGKAAIAIVDPPRSGCHRDLLDSLIQTAPEKIVYVSCDPATLSRDVKVLTEGGYRFVEATPVDMFPHTGHVECVVLMSKVK